MEGFTHVCLGIFEKGAEPEGLEDRSAHAMGSRGKTPVYRQLDGRSRESPRS